MNDSKLVYIICHALLYGVRLAMCAGVFWLAYELKTVWVLAALLVCPWGSYTHDFNGVNQTKEAK